MADAFSEKPYVSLRELLISATFAILLWIWSFSFLFPIFISLVFCSWLRNKFFAFIFNAFFATRWPRTGEIRKKLFDLLDEEYVSKHRSRPIRYLEIGVGTGANFQYYSGNHSLTLVDKNPDFISYFEKELKKYPNVKVDKVVISMAENMKELKNEDYDIVIATHFFCSTTNSDAVLKEIKRVLKPGGKMAFLEHIGYPVDHLMYWVQALISPLWKVYFNGCRCDHHWRSIFLKNFSDVLHEVVYPTFMMAFIRPHAYGVATK